MPTYVTNKRGEKFKQGDTVLCIGYKHSGDACGLAPAMKQHPGHWLTISYFIDRHRGTLRFENVEYAWHVDDFTFDKSLYNNVDGMVSAKSPKKFVKWFNLKSDNYKRFHTNNYFLFIEDKDKPATWDALDRSREIGHYDYPDRYSTRGAKYVVDRKGTAEYEAEWCATHSCFGGFMGTFGKFFNRFKHMPTHTMQELRATTESRWRTIVGGKPRKGVQIATPAQWKEAMLNFKRGGMVPHYWDMDEIFADLDSDKFYFNIDLRRISKERWYWYASMARYLAENPRLLHAFNGLCKDFPKAHPLVLFIMASSVYHGRTHAAVECIGLVNVFGNAVSVNTKDVSLYATRVARFLTQMPGEKLLSKEKPDRMEMWRIFKFFREQSSEMMRGFVYRVRPPKASYESLDSLLTYNPFTREVG